MGIKSDVAHKKPYSKMRYIDSGYRSEEETVAHWFQAKVSGDIKELRVQSGYFSSDVFGLLGLEELMEDISSSDCVTKIVIGSNKGDTLAEDVITLVEKMGISREEAKLAIVSFSSGLFHPKVYHAYREDGSQCAYVGSANLTPQGFSKHIEAGVTVDSREGDSEETLRRIANSVDAWFEDDSPGIYRIDSIDAVSDLALRGVLSSSPTREEYTSSTSGESDAEEKARLSRLISVSTRSESESDADQPPPTEPDLQTEGHQQTPITSVATHAEFPDLFYFSPDAIELREQDEEYITGGREALTGIGLPNGAVGIIVRLNKDAARKFGTDPGSGTPNITLPLKTMRTIRFGFYGEHLKPGAEFVTRMRYRSDLDTFESPPEVRRVLIYGRTPSEDSHPDQRLSLSTPETTKIGERLRSIDLTVPGEGDLALVEWPTLDSPEYRITFTDRNSDLCSEVERIFEQANRDGNMIGEGSSCWLPVGVSPSWG